MLRCSQKYTILNVFCSPTLSGDISTVERQCADVECFRRHKCCCRKALTGDTDAMMMCPGTPTLRGRITGNRCQSHPKSFEKLGCGLGGRRRRKGAATPGQQLRLKTRQSRKGDLSATAKSYLNVSCVLLSDQSRWSLAIHKAAWPSFLRLCLKTLLGNAAFFMRAAVV